MLNMQLSHSLRQGVLRSLVMYMWYIQEAEAFSERHNFTYRIECPQISSPNAFIMHFIPWFKYCFLLAIVI